MDQEREEIQGSPVDEYIQPQRNRTKIWIYIAVLLSIVVFAVIIKTSILDKSMTPEELKSSIKLFDISSHWVEKEKIDEEDFKGIVLVPEISFRLQNIGQGELQYVFLLGVFRLLNATRAMGEGYTMLFNEPLPPGAASERVVLRSGFGYRATSKKAFEKNSRNWRSAEVEVFARSRSSGWVFIKRFYISRTIEGLDTEINIL